MRRVKLTKVASSPKSHSSKMGFGDLNSNPMQESLFFHLSGHHFVAICHLCPYGRGLLLLDLAAGRIMIPPFLGWTSTPSPTSQVVDAPQFPRRKEERVRKPTELSSKEDEIGCVALKCRL